MEQPYPATGPFEYVEHGQHNYQFHWLMSDLIDPLLESGLILRRMAETLARDVQCRGGASYLQGTEPHLQDWQENPRAGLPIWLTITAQKPESS